MSAFAIVLASTACAGNSGENKKSNEPTKEENKMEVVSLNKADFLKKVYNYEANPKEWKFEGSRPAIVDFYATWCGPCKKEMPAMKALEAEYKDNKDIVFMGISVDASKNIQKWKDFVIKEQLPGVQLFAGDMAGPALSKPYKITGIPRFMLVGKDGSLIYMDAPRPSSSEIRAVLNDALKK